MPRREGVVVANDGFTQATAQAAIVRNDASAVAFGRLFIANPDLVQRFRANASLSPWDPETFYSHEAAGYTDYPELTPRARSGAEPAPVRIEP